MNNEERTSLRSLVSQGIVEIDFVKVNGQARKLFASTNPLYIPAYDPEDVSSKTSPNAEVMRVIDTEINEWRSIRYDSVNSYRLLDVPALVTEE